MNCRDTLNRDGRREDTRSCNRLHAGRCHRGSPYPGYYAGEAAGTSVYLLRLTLSLHSRSLSGSRLGQHLLFLNVSRPMKGKTGRRALALGMQVHRTRT